MTPSVSIVLPTYRRAALLPEIVPAWLALAPDGELLLVDDGSDDATPEVCAELARMDPRIRPLRCELNGGTPTARNIGLQAARAPWVLFGEDDARPAPDYFRTLRACAERCGADAIAGRLLSEGQRPDPRRPFPELDPGRWDVRYDGDAEEDVAFPLLHALALVRTERARALGFDAGYRGNFHREESDFFLRLWEDGGRVFACPHTAVTHLARAAGGCERRAGSWRYRAWLVANQARFLARHRSSLRRLAPEAASGPRAALRYGLDVAYQGLHASLEEAAPGLHRGLRRIAHGLRRQLARPTGLPLWAAGLPLRGLAVSARRPSRPLPEEVASIALLSLDRLGDLARATSLLRALAWRFPGASIDLFLSAAGAPLAPCLPVAVRTRVLAAPWHTPGRPWPRELPATLRELRAASYDLALGLRFGEPWEAFLLSCVRASCRIGVDAGGWGFGIDRRIAYDPLREGPETAPRERFLAALGVSGPLPAPALTAPKLPVVRELDGLPGPRIALCPEASSEERGLPGALVEALVRALPGTPVLLGSAAGQAPDRALDLRGRTDVPGLCAVLAACDAAVSVDSGPMHLAAALGLPVLALYGPSDPALSAPGAARLRVLRAPGGVLGRLAPEAVATALAELLAARPPRYCARPFPAYAHRPGRTPHPRRAGGHSVGLPEEAPEALPAERYRELPLYLYGVDLYHAGYWWEAHEAWEALWHAYGRRGAVAELLKALIQTAAAALKREAGQARPERRHAERSRAILRGLAAREGPRLLGLDLARVARDSEAWSGGGALPGLWLRSLSGIPPAPPPGGSDGP